MIESVTLYKSLSPLQLAELINLDWKAFPAVDPEQKIFAPKLHREYAEMLARQLEMASYQAGYVVMFRLQRQFVEQFSVETVAYIQHREYRIPIAALGDLNRALVGKIELVSGFAAMVHDGWKPVAVNQFVGYH